MSVAYSIDRLKGEARALAAVKMRSAMRDVVLAGGFEALEWEVSAAKQRLVEEFRDHPTTEGWLG